MAKYCPIVERNVTYLFCEDCDHRAECPKHIIISESKDSEKGGINDD